LGASSITELEDEHGGLFTDQPNLERICLEYYSSLYKARPELDEQARAMEQSLSSISDRLSPAMKTKLEAPIALSELTEALQGMAAGKAPGLDGVITEFF
jgi:hypothetical protein